MNNHVENETDVVYRYVTCAKPLLSLLFVGPAVPLVLLDIRRNGSLVIPLYRDQTTRCRATMAVTSCEHPGNFKNGSLDRMTSVEALLRDTPSLTDGILLPVVYCRYVQCCPICESVRFVTKQTDRNSKVKNVHKFVKQFSSQCSAATVQQMEGKQRILL